MYLPSGAGRGQLAMTEPHDQGGWLPDGLSLAVNATPEPEEAAAPDTAAEYTCGRCERNQHRRCTELACACCEGSP
jgi:hypothetical protein